MILVAVDPSTTRVGLAFWSQETYSLRSWHPVSEEPHFPKHFRDSRSGRPPIAWWTVGRRCRSIDCWLREQFQILQPEVVVTEIVGFHSAKGVASIRAMGWAAMAVRVAAATIGLDDEAITDYHPGTWKKLATGSGTTPNDDLVSECARIYGVECANVDEAAAYLMARAYLIEHGE